MKKQIFVKITKGHAIITIHFETLIKVIALKYGEKTQQYVTFRLGHRSVKKIKKYKSERMRLAHKIL